MKLKKEIIDNLIEVSSSLVNYKTSLEMMLDHTDDFNSYMSFLNELSYDQKKTLIGTLKAYVQVGKNAIFHSISLESEAVADELLQDISEHLVCNGHFSELERRSSGKGNIRTKNIVAKYIKLSRKCKNYFESFNKLCEVKDDIMEFQSIFDNLDDEENAELLALVCYGHIDSEWSELVDATRPNISSDFVDKMILVDFFSEKLKYGYNKYLKNQN